VEEDDDDDDGYAYWLLSNEGVKGITCRHRLILRSVYVSVANFDWVRNAGIKNALRIVHQKQRLESSELWKSLPPISFLGREQLWTLLIFAPINP